ncbi:Zn-dependent hydrolase [Lentibacillus halophilus]|uniref:Zn-dependent hydrolase n=1 Tax=Lentibacillus halophilus TaxID=295065 RepID=A0ABN0Z1Z8_9BACI
MTLSKLHGIDIDRLMSNIEDYAQYGKNEYGGITRPSFSEEDKKVRNKFINELKDLGLEITVDGAANIWARKKGTGMKTGAIVVGSHLDSVPNGGKFDGPLGVLMAKELLISLEEHNIQLDHDLEIVSFTAEESNDFNLSTFGSRSFTGKLPLEKLKDVTDSTGTKLTDALLEVDGNLDSYPEMYRQYEDKKAFFELHIEQGKRLESQNISVASVDRMAGVYRNNIKLIGESNHSGTTTMDSRTDALTAASEMILQVENVCQEHKNDVVGTVGKANVYPNATNIVPGEVEFLFEVRGQTNKEMFHYVISEILSQCKDIASKRGITMEEDVIINQDPIPLDNDLIDVLNQSAEQVNEPHLTLTSMAVHDAAHMSSVTKSVMLFVKSIDGKSHCPEEYTRPDDIEAAGKVLLQSLISADAKLS